MLQFDIYLICVLFISIISGVCLAWFCGVEIGIYRLNPLRLHLAARKGDVRAKLLLSLVKEARHSLIGALLLGTNLFGYIIAVAFTSYLVDTGYSHLQAELLTCLVLTPLLFVFTEAVPKSCFFLRTTTYMLRSARALKITYYIFKYSGLDFIFNLLVKALLYIAVLFSGKEYRKENIASIIDRLDLLVREGFSSSTFSAVQVDIAERIFQLSGRTIGDIILLRNKIFYVYDDISCGDLLQRLKESEPYTYIPVLSRDKDSMIGFIYIYDILWEERIDPKRNACDYMRKAPKLRVDEKLITAIEVLHTSGAYIASVVDYDGEFVGIITLKDLLDELVCKV